MSFQFKATFSVSGKVVEYQWATTPTDTQIEEIIKEMKLFRYEKEFIKALKMIRDGQTEKYVPWDRSFVIV